MKHIVIVGNSAAGVSAAQAIREKDKEVKISIISEEAYPSYFRLKIDEILIKNLKTEALLFKSNEFYEQADINVRLGQKVEKINTRKNNLVLLDKTRIEYDVLIISTGMSANISKDVKGSNKHGVLGFRSLSNIKDITELIPISHTACVWGCGIAAIRAACALNKKGLEVKLITKKERILPEVVGIEKAQAIQQRLKELNIEIIYNMGIEEIFGDADVKALKLNSGKVIGCDILVVDKNLTPNTRFLEDSEVVLDKGIIVNEFLRTNVDNVFAAGDVIKRKVTANEIYDFPDSWEKALEQGKVVGNNALMFANLKLDEMIAYEEKPQTKQLELFGEIKASEKVQAAVDQEIFQPDNS